MSWLGMDWGSWMCYDDNVGLCEYCGGPVDREYGEVICRNYACPSHNSYDVDSYDENSYDRNVLGLTIAIIASFVGFKYLIVVILVAL